MARSAGVGGAGEGRDWPGTSGVLDSGIPCSVPREGGTLATGICIVWAVDGGAAGGIGALVWAVGGAAACGGAPTVTEGGVARTEAEAAAVFGSYFFVRCNRTSLVIALSESCTPIPVVATDS